VTTENLTKRVTRLSGELAEAEARIIACNHMFPEFTQVVRQVSDPILLRYEGKGSDPEAIYDQNNKKDEHGWERTCERCGKLEYTTKTQPVTFGPDFGGSHR